MYLDYFSLKEKPFSITPDPAYLFLSERHAEALAHLVYGVTDSGGFIQLTGEVGTGKTTIVRSLLEQLPENVDVALVLNPRLSVNEFLHTICEELHVEVEKGASNKDCIDVLNRFLLDAYGKDRRVVLLIDEAQNLSVEVLEQVRLLTNLETHKDKLLQIILVGQPELQTLLQRQDLRQLAQRITARYHLRPLNQQESHDYLSHRLSVAGGQPDLITSSAKTTIYKAAKGIPRLMNVIADRALLGAYSQEKRQADNAVAKLSIREVVGDEIAVMGQTPKRRLSVWWGLPIVVGLAALAWFGLSHDRLSQFLPVSTQAQSDTVILDNSAPLNQAAETAGVIDTPGTMTMAESIETARVLDDTESMVSLDESDSEPVALNELLSANMQLTTSEQAFNQLLAAWGKGGFVSHLNACDNLLAQGLRCYFSESLAWDQLLKLDRPMILEVLDAQGQTHQLSITSMDESNATVSLGADQQKVLLDELVSAWTGKALLFWKFDAPSDFPLIQMGDRGIQVAWLKEHLNQIGIEPLAAPSSQSFGPITQKQVMNFQETAGLDVDGVVGIHTFIALNTALQKADVPSLFTRIDSQ